MEASDSLSKVSDLWNILHQRALKIDENPNVTDDNIFLTEFGTQIPLYAQNGDKCACREHWANFKMKNPPNFFPKGLYFGWTVDLHNYINQILNKPVLSYEEALKYHKDKTIS